MLRISLFRVALLTALALFVAGTAHAGLTQSVEPSTDDVEAVVAGAVATQPRTSSTSGSEPGVSPPPVPEPLNEVTGEAGRTGAQAQERLGRAIDEALLVLDVEALRALAEGEVQKAQATVGEAQGDLEDLLGDDAEPAPDEEEKAAPVAPASQQSIWEGLQAPMMLMAGTVATFGILGWLIGQSATVGAGAAGSAAARGGRRFLPYASPLFTRFEKDTVLGHPKREAIYGEIVEKPGVTLQDLCGATGLSRTAVTHHLRLMEQQHLVVSKRVGRSRHFFENGGRYGRDQKDAYAVLHNDRSKDIHGFIRKHPGSIQKDLCAAFDIQASVAHWHVKRLVEANLVEAIRQGRTVSYFPSGEASGYA